MKLHVSNRDGFLASTIDSTPTAPGSHRCLFQTYASHQCWTASISSFETHAHTASTMSEDLLAAYPHLFTDSAFWVRWIDIQSVVCPEGDMPNEMRNKKIFFLTWKWLLFLSGAMTWTQSNEVWGLLPGLSCRVVWSDGTSSIRKCWQITALVLNNKQRSVICFSKYSIVD